LILGTDGGVGENWRDAGNLIHREFDELEKAGILPLHILQMTTM